MQLEQFEKVIKLLKEAAKETEKAEKYVKPRIFNKHLELIATLLESIYKDSGITILFKWLGGDITPYKVIIDKDTTIVYPLDTVEDLYKVMCLHYRFRDDVEVMRLMKNFPHPLDKV